MKNILPVLSILLAPYLLISFIALTIDFSEWRIITRIFYVCTIIFGLIGYVSHK